MYADEEDSKNLDILKMQALTVEKCAMSQLCLVYSATFEKEKWSTKNCSSCLEGIYLNIPKIISTLNDYEKV